MMRLPRCLTDGSSGGVQVGADVSGRSVDRGGPGGGHKSGSPRVPGRGGSWPRGETFFRIMDLGNRGGPGLFLPETLTEVGSHSRCFSISQGECFGPGEDLTVLVTIGHSMGIGSARLTPNVEPWDPTMGVPCVGFVAVASSSTFRTNLSANRRDRFTTEGHPHATSLRPSQVHQVAECWTGVG